MIRDEPEDQIFVRNGAQVTHEKLVKVCSYMHLFLFGGVGLVQPTLRCS
jgi:hypothetical protein